MRVNNVHLTSAALTQAEAREASALQAGEAPGADAGQASAHVPSAQLTDLLAQLRQAPEVRQERVQEVAQKLTAGYYLTPDAAQKTADAIQQSPE